jgi:hypothetical protein
VLYTQVRRAPRSEQLPHIDRSPTATHSSQGHSVLLLFAFEHALLLLEAARTAYRYVIYLIARRFAARAAAEALAAAAAAAAAAGDGVAAPPPAAVPAGAPGAGEWPNRTLYLLYGKLVLDVARLATNVVYFVVRGTLTLAHPAMGPAGRRQSVSSSLCDRCQRR